MTGNYLGTDLRDLRFVFLEQFGLDELKKIDRFAELTEEDVVMIMEESDRQARELFAPVNASADHSGGCRLEDGQVRVPEGFKEAYERFIEGGWIGLSLKAESGGQDIPNFIRVGSDECFVAYNPSLHTYPGLTTAAARVIESFGTDWQKETFLGKLVEGTWTGTMCLTEPNAGSDIGDIRTSAKLKDGKYYIRGTKLFISGGDHDLTENIVHLVLARVEGAPKGVLGISLFIVPKFKINPDGTLGELNDVRPVAVEKKMGLKGSATVQLQFGDEDACEGYILGGEGEGLLLMFQMMYEARIGVGHQAMAMASNAYQYALRYAHERYQGSAPEQMGDPNAPRVPIIRHPDVRRMLMEAGAYVAATRRLISYAAHLIDQAWNIPPGPELKRLKSLYELLIPVAKAYATDRGLDVANLAMLVHGGYGYIQEYPVEQILRDVKVTSVYEGTNGIQSIDLLLRNVLARRGKALRLYFEEVDKTLSPYRDNERLKHLFEEFDAARSELMATTEALQGKRQSDLHHLLLVSVPYMEMFGHLASAHLLLWGAGVADKKLHALYAENGAEDEEAREALLERDGDARYYHNLIQTTRFFFYYILPKLYGLARVVRRGDHAPMDMRF